MYRSYTVVHASGWRKVTVMCYDLFCYHSNHGNAPPRRLSRVRTNGRYVVHLFFLSHKYIPLSGGQTYLSDFISSLSISQSWRAQVCFKCLYFRDVLQVFHIDVAKVDRDVAHVAMNIHLCFKYRF
jgi:hypothetical protein